MLQFKEVYENIVSEILKNYESEKLIPAPLLCAYRKQLIYVMPEDPDASTWHFIVTFYQYLKPDASVSEIRLAQVLGICCQMYQIFLNMLDDFVACGDFRYKKDSWSKLNNHDASIVVYDSLMFEHSIYIVLKKYFATTEKLYVQLLDCFLDLGKIVWVGQRMKNYYSFKNCNAERCIDELNWNNYIAYAKLKFSAPFIYLPVCVTMIYAGIERISNKNLYERVRKVCDKISVFGAVKDDYYDSFPRNDKIVKTVDSDIRRGHFSWCFLSAKLNCSTLESKRLLLNNYGKDDDACVISVKGLYRDINLPSIYQDFISKEPEKIKSFINELIEEELVRKILIKFLGYIVKW